MKRQTRDLKQVHEFYDYIVDYAMDHNFTAAEILFTFGLVAGEIIEQIKEQHGEPADALKVIEAGIAHDVFGLSADLVH